MSYKILKEAPTLKDLKERIDEAIKIAGEDAPWNGYDDEGIYISPSGGSKDGRWVAIFPEKQT